MNSAVQRRASFDGWSLLVLVLFLVPPFFVSFIGSQWTSPNVDSAWFRDLDKPSWYPPGWAFGVVWTILYAAMGVAAWLVWRARERGTPVVALALWAVQLAFNLGWTYAFFEQRSLLGGVVVIVVLWLLIIATMSAFLPWSRPAALLMAPYLAWVTFAAALTISIWQMN